MARTSNITFGQVAQIADAMKAAGTRPTARAVRERIGSGSMGTIHNLLKQWQGKGPSEDNEEKPDLPQHVTDAIMDFVSTMTGERIEDMTEQLRDAQDAADDLARENDRYYEQLNASEESAYSYRSEIGRLQGIIEQLRGELEKANGIIQEEKAKVADEQHWTNAARQQAAVAGARLEAAEVRTQMAEKFCKDVRDFANEQAKRLTALERENAALQSALNEASRRPEDQCKPQLKKPTPSRKAPAKNTAQMPLIDSQKPAPSSPQPVKKSAKKAKPLSDAGNTETPGTNQERKPRSETPGADNTANVADTRPATTG